MAESAKPRIAEVIVVEGRDDTAAVLRAVEAITIETHGYGIARDTWERLEAAYRRTGLIIFTDPDHAGRMIRRALKGRNSPNDEVTVKSAGSAVRTFSVPSPTLRVA